MRTDIDRPDPIRTVWRNPSPPLFIGGPFHMTRRDVPWGTNTVEVADRPPEHLQVYPRKPPWWRPLARARWRGRMDAEISRPILLSVYRCERWAQPHPKHFRIGHSLHLPTIFTRYFVHDSIPDDRIQDAIGAVHPCTAQVIDELDGRCP